MTPSAALTGAGAVLRVTRGAAGRRVLQVVLLVGGLFVLGFLCGQPAHAAGGASPEAGTVAVSTTPESVRSAMHAAPVAGTAKSAAKSVEDSTDPRRPVTEPVVRPVGDLVQTVTGGLADEPSQFPPLPGMPSLPGQPEVPSLPGHPEAPSLPELPELPELPGLPGLPGIPADILPIGAAPQQPGGAAPEQPGAAERGDGSEARSAARAGAVYGPRFAHGAESDVSGVRVAQGADTVRTPPQQAPGDEAGVLGRHSAVDHGGARHGEPHAVTLDHRAPLSRLRGVTAVVAVDGTRDRNRDIPEFPG
ncbi:hypothetical protein [Streptomyces bluensis]|uniref:hypothetical protein n=1 Tax=Streptomyces bluensis TaxID=33897 RepID=UPI0016756913|nr:hypothetical protein [Streptomyces bluensis]GGZ57589.1 hypothetical protein GCM10010344_24630 [Streptomyces bluensis]